MSELPMEATPTPPCVCVAEHRPPVLEVQAHHLWPKYLGGPPHPMTLLGLCATTHTNVHRTIRALVKADKAQQLANPGAEAVVLSQDQLREPGRPAVPRYTWATAANGFLAWVAAGRPSTAALVALLGDDGAHESDDHTHEGHA